VPQESEALDLEQILNVLRRRALLILFCIVIVAGATYGFSKRKTKQYTAGASLTFSVNPVTQQIAGLSSGGLSTTDLLVQEANEVEQVKGGETAARTAALVGGGVTEESVLSSVSVAGHGESGVVVVSATTTVPELSAKIANTYARQFVVEQRASLLHSYQSALRVVDKELAELSPSQRVGSDAVDLQDRAQTLRLLLELRESNVQVTQEAAVPTSPSSPKTSKDTAIGVLVGLLIGLGLAFSLERFDRRIRRPRDLEAIYRAPLLGAVPSSNVVSRAIRGRAKRRTALPSADADAFRLIYAHLRFLNSDRKLRSVVVGSAESGDGRTVVASHLAEAAARSGLRVLLLEADLRRPSLAAQFALSHQVGLAEVLMGTASIDEAVQSVELGFVLGDPARGRTLDVLSAGNVLPSDPSELFEGARMVSVLTELGGAYELIVIDTPPLAAVSDAFPLLTRADGIIIVGRIGRSRRESALRLHQVLASSDVPVCGVIATAARSAGSSAHVNIRNGTPSSNGATTIESASDSLASAVEA
jgi:capsular exopolysaccharide synthesis family protein